MRRLIVIFLSVIAVGGATGAVASGDDPPTLPSDVTCSTDAAAMKAKAAEQGVTLPTDAGTGALICFYPEHDK